MMDDGTQLIHGAVLVGVLVVMPLATGRHRTWLGTGAAVVASLLLPVGGWSAAVAVVWVLVAISGLPRGRHVDQVDWWAELASAGFAAAAGAAFVTSRGGWRPFGLAEPIIELTAVHFTYAGVGALCLARSATPGRLRDLATVLTVAAPPVVAIGFLVAHPLPQVGGAVLMSGGVLVTASLQLRNAGHLRGVNAGLLLLSGIAPWAPMGLAVSWAAAQHWDLPALSIPDMARTHGVANAVFVITGLAARRRTAGDGRAVLAEVPAGAR